MDPHRYNRRDLIAAAVTSALYSAGSAWPSLAWAQVPGLKPIDRSLFKTPLKLQPLAFQPATTGAGAVGPWGEVRIRETAGGLLPVFVQTSDKSGVLDLSKRKAAVSLGDGAILLTSSGIAFGKGTTPKAWDKGSVKTLLDTLTKEEKLRRALFELRAALLTAYPFAVVSSKGKRNDKSAAQANKMARGMGKGTAPRKENCTTQTVIDTVTSQITEYVNVWKTAEQQFSDCVDAQVKAGILGGEIAAMAYCGLIGFVDIVVGVMEVIRTVTEEVTRTVVTCVLAVPGALRDLFRGIDLRLPGPSLALPATPKAGTDLNAKDISKALDQLKALIGGFHPFLDCLLKAKWGIAAADASFLLGAAGDEVPYGVRVCLPADCARDLKISNTGSALGSAGTALVSILAALVPDIAALAGTVGIPAAAGVAAIAAALGPEVTAAMIVIAVMLLLLLYYAAAVAAQIEFLPDTAFADGEVCIEHPTLVIAVVNVILAPAGVSLAALIPPIVTG
ncbi:MAG: hypothetical protein U1F11_01505 [Steroidobacteraceae bacterium]